MAAGEQHWRNPAPPAGDKHARRGCVHAARVRVGRMHTQRRVQHAPAGRQAGWQSWFPPWRSLAGGCRRRGGTARGSGTAGPSGGSPAALQYHTRGRGPQVGSRQGGQAGRKASGRWERAATMLAGQAGATAAVRPWLNCCTAPTLHPRRVHAASTLCPRCIHAVSTLHPCCAHAASNAAPRCTPATSTLPPAPCLPRSMQAGSTTSCSPRSARSVSSSMFHATSARAPTTCSAYASRSASSTAEPLMATNTSAERPPSSGTLPAPASGGPPKSDPRALSPSGGWCSPRWPRVTRPSADSRAALNLRGGEGQGRAGVGARLGGPGSCAPQNPWNKTHILADLLYSAASGSTMCTRLPVASAICRRAG
jgi:hypothetical protein